MKSTLLGQDDAGAWMARNFPELLYTRPSFSKGLITSLPPPHDAVRSGLAGGG
jgi:hypothetical protein